MTFDEWWKENRFYLTAGAADASMLTKAAWEASRKAALLEAAEYINGSIPGNTASLYLKRMAEDK
jgi:hypothetical protein